MNTLVTGGAGFIGSNLVQRLVSDGHQVTVVDNLSTGKRENLPAGQAGLHKNAEFFELDISDLDAIKPTFEGKDIVFHVAALPRLTRSIEDPASTFKSNVTGTLNVLLAARDAGVKRVVYSASSSAYGFQDKLPLCETMPPKPLNPYGLSKYVGEELCREFTNFYGLDTISLRYFNVYGPRMDMEGDYATVIGKFLRLKSSGQPLTIIGDGKQTRDFTNVDDVVRANILASQVDKGGGEVINIGAGDNHSVQEIADLIGGGHVYIPERPGEVRDTLADISKAKRILGWEPKVSLKDGINQLMTNV
ncbi:MAG: SDR family oxidoreductase [Candidatus Spechtbacterales bacterium]